MWSPVPKSKVIKRPRPLENFHYQKQKPLKKKNLLEFRPENHYGNRYFGIRNSDITEYLEQQVPSHAFAPANEAGLGGYACQNKRPSTAPAAVPWFGRRSSDVSSWLRKLPPAHLGADPDNKPLPYFPARSSIVTDNRWQTRDFPPLPNPLWHYWAEKPKRTPHTTNSNQVQFDTVVDSAKKSRSAPKQITQNPDQAPRSGAPTPRSDRSNPSSRAETPRVPETPTQSQKLSGTGGKLSGTTTPRSGATTPREPEFPLQFCHCAKRQSGVASTTGSVTGKSMDLDVSKLCKVCNCEKVQMTLRSPGSSYQQSTPRSPKLSGTLPVVYKEESSVNGGSHSVSRVGTPRPGTACRNAGSCMGTQRPGTASSNASSGVGTLRPGSASSNAGSCVGTPRPGTASSSASPGVGTPRPGTASSSASSGVGTPRLRTASINSRSDVGTPKVGEKKIGVHSHRHHKCPTKGSLAKNRAAPRSKTPPVPFHEVITNSKKPPGNPDHVKNGACSRNWASSDELRQMSPECYATKSIWQEKFRKEQKEGPWPITVH